jgi:threonylcarbamoyladenosine tRNA methylthiotransferase MtaB
MSVTFYIEQFGCRATQADAAAIERQLLDSGCAPAADRDSAEFVVVNTCTVTAAADAEARDSIRRIHARNPAARIIATGCYAQRAPQDLAALPGVSRVVGNSHKAEIAALIRDPGFIPVDKIASAPRAAACPPGSPLSDPFSDPFSDKILCGDIFAHSHFLSAPVLGGERQHTRPTLKIQDGCNLRCSYCVIPFVRGKSHSMPPDQVVEEIARLSSRGFREVVLSGINLGTWGRDLSPRAGLLELLRRLLEETRLERLRLSSIEPQDVTLDLIDLFGSTPRLAEHFHMPLQSGSDGILAAMHRWYRTAHYARRLELIRERLPHAAIGADVIAGFPGESEADHVLTLDFIERLPFTYLHVFSYSARPGTEAALAGNQVPARVIKRRARELRALGEAKSAAFRRSQIGRTLRVLTLGRDPAKLASTPALSSNYLRVELGGLFAPNAFHDVRIGEARDALLLAG